MVFPGSAPCLRGSQVPAHPPAAETRRFSHMFVDYYSGPPSYG